MVEAFINFKISVSLKEELVLARVISTLLLRHITVYLHREPIMIAFRIEQTVSVRGFHCQEILTLAKRLDLLDLHQERRRNALRLFVFDSVLQMLSKIFTNI